MKIAVEGNIGVGKSTLLNELKVALQLRTGTEWIIHDEGVDDDAEFQRLLKAFYEDPNKRIELQTWLTARRIEEYENLDPNKNYLLERSFLGDMVFCQANMLNHEKPTGEYTSYFYDIAAAMNKYTYDHILYLTATPSRCHRSIHNRDRDAEKTIPLSYIQTLDRYYTCVLKECAAMTDTPLLAVDWQSYGNTRQVRFITERLIGAKYVHNNTR